MRRHLLHGLLNQVVSCMRCVQLLPKIHGGKNGHSLIFLSIAFFILRHSLVWNYTLQQFIHELVEAYHKMEHWICKLFPLGATGLSLSQFSYDELVDFLGNQFNH